MLHPSTPSHNIEQACTTYGPRSKWGPRKLLIWPAKPKFTSIWLDFWWKHYKNLKTLNQSGQQMFQQHFFGPPWNLSCASLLSSFFFHILVSLFISNCHKELYLGVLHLMANEQAWIFARDLNKTRIWRTSKRAPRRQRVPSFSPETE